MKSVGMAIASPANLLEVNIADRKISDLGDGTPVGNLDGIEPIGDDFLVTDWVAGGLYRIDRKGKATQLAAPTSATCRRLAYC